MLKKSFWAPAACSAGFWAVPRAAEACAVCFGQAGANLQKGFFWGILLLLLLPVLLFSVIAGMIVASLRRKQALAVKTGNLSHAG